MKKAVLAMMLFAGSMLAGPRFTVGIGFGAPAVTFVRPVCPGPGYVWTDGYYAPNGVWIQGFWGAPAVGYAVRPGWGAPRYYGPHYFPPRYFAYEHGGYGRGRDYRR